MERLKELLNGGGGSYILPFMWMKGEDKETIREEIGKIAECGIREICLESRPHPDFAGPGWWDSLDCVLEEVRKRGMRVWILDDRKFPTGYANGGFEKRPELAKTYLAERHMDIVGPKKDAAVLIGPFLNPDGTLLSVLAIKRADGDSTDLMAPVIDLTDRVKNGFVYLDIPEGRYRLFVIYTTQKGSGRPNYMNLLDTRSVRVLIDEVYEPHYARYAADFGTSIAGFFSDEPEIGNEGGYDFHETPGRKDRKLPWSDELREELEKKWGADFARLLPALWFEMGQETARIRTEFMESVTDLVYRCFSGQVGVWCADHGVDYIGHIIEDDNAHTRMGCSIGHYFKEMRGQHMGGVDVVHFQILPGFEDPVHQWLSWDTDGEFFHYGLAKLGSSAAHIDPNKKGRSMCEIFGNYGWAMGVGKMRWLTNHMLARGINHYTPHAFSMIFPDRDCPPHFYARGNNPQFKQFAALMRYMNRMCHLINDGTHRADAAVLYHGEAEWSGGVRMAFQKPGRELMEHQLDYDVVPEDIFGQDGVSVKNGRFAVNQETYSCLILPCFENLPDRAEKFVKETAGEGLPVFVIDRLPERTTHGKAVSEEFKKAVTVVPLKEIAAAVRKLGAVLPVEGGHPHLRTFVYEFPDMRICQFFNEAVYESCDTVIKFGGEYTAVVDYDAFRNRARAFQMKDGSFELHLDPGEAKLLIPVRREEELAELNLSAEPVPVLVTAEKVETEWKVSLRESAAEEFEYQLTLPAGAVLPNMNGPEMFPEFSGTYRYEGIVRLEEQRQQNGETRENRKIRMYFPEFGDCLRLSINGKEADLLVGSPAGADVTEFLKEGDNEVSIEVTNTLVWKLKDPVSTQMQLDPTGMTAAPVLEILMSGR